MYYDFVAYNLSNACRKSKDKTMAWSSVVHKRPIWRSIKQSRSLRALDVSSPPFWNDYPSGKKRKRVLSFSCHLEFRGPDEHYWLGKLEGPNMEAGRIQQEVKSSQKKISHKCKHPKNNVNDHCQKVKFYVLRYIVPFMRRPYVGIFTRDTSDDGYSRLRPSCPFWWTADNILFWWYHQLILAVGVTSCIPGWDTTVCTKTVSQKAI